MGNEALMTIDSRHKGRVVEVRFNPDLVKYPDGYPIRTITDERFAPMLEKLRAGTKELKPEQDPYSVRDPNMKAIAKKMKDASGSKLTGEIQWLIDALFPRILLTTFGVRTDEGIKRGIEVTTPVPHNIIPPGHPSMEFLLDGAGNYGPYPDDAVMTNGRLLRQPRVKAPKTDEPLPIPEEMRNQDYTLCLFPDQMPRFAPALLRAGGRQDAFFVKYHAKDIHEDGSEQKYPKYGAVLFQSQSTLVTFFLDKVETAIEGFDIYSDPAVVSDLCLQRAHNLLYLKLREINAAAEAASRNKGAPVTPESIDETMKLIEAKARLAAKFWPENPEIKPFIDGLSGVFQQKKNMLDLHEEMTLANKIQKDAKDVMIDITEKGMKQKKHLLRKATWEGMHPSEVSQKMAAIFKELDGGFEKYGLESQPLLAAFLQLQDILLNQLPRMGFVIDEFGAEPMKVFARIMRKINQEQHR